MGFSQAFGGTPICGNPPPQSVHSRGKTRWKNPMSCAFQTRPYGRVWRWDSLMIFNDGHGADDSLADGLWDFQIWRYHENCGFLEMGQTSNSSIHIHSIFGIPLFSETPSSVCPPRNCRLWPGNASPEKSAAGFALVSRSDRRADFQKVEVVQRFIDPGIQF